MRRALPLLIDGTYPSHFPSLSPRLVTDVFTNWYTGTGSFAKPFQTRQEQEQEQHRTFHPHPLHPRTPPPQKHHRAASRIPAHSAKQL